MLKLPLGKLLFLFRDADAIDTRRGSDFDPG